MSSSRIPANQCKIGYLYKISSRNLRYGIFTGGDWGGFIGIRTKFGYQYLFTEYHYDLGGRCGTVFPKIEICQSPFTEEQLYEEIPEVFWWLERKENEYEKCQEFQNLINDTELDA